MKAHLGDHLRVVQEGSWAEVVSLTAASLQQAVTTSFQAGCIDDITKLKVHSHVRVNQRLFIETFMFADGCAQSGGQLSQKAPPHTHS